MKLNKQGRLKNWIDDKGFGFIAGENGEPDLFIHISAFSQQGFRPQINQQLLFTASKDKHGRSRAIDAYLVGSRVKARPKVTSRRFWQILLIAFSITFFILVAVLIFIGKIPGIILYWYVMLSFLLFALYKTDKQAAKLKHWRTKENTLHILSLLGGWSGALIAQQTLRHKSKKTSFKVVYFLTLVVNLTLFGLLFTQQGASILKFIDVSLQSGLMELFSFVKNLLT